MTDLKVIPRNGTPRVRSPWPWHVLRVDRRGQPGPIIVTAGSSVIVVRAESTQSSPLDLMLVPGTWLHVEPANAILLGRKVEPVDVLRWYAVHAGLLSRPVLFLDIDGVLNDHVFLHERHPNACDALDWAEMLNPECVARLNRIVEMTGCDVVVSSSWRAGGSDEWLRAVLARRGFVGTIVGRTENLQSGGIEAEILRYVEEHKVQRWIVLEDSALPGLGHHLVQTSWHGGGLLDQHVEQAISAIATQWL